MFLKPLNSPEAHFSYLQRQLWRVGRRWPPCQEREMSPSVLHVFAEEAESHPGLPTLRPMHFTLLHLPHSSLAQGVPFHQREYYLVCFAFFIPKLGIIQNSHPRLGWWEMFEISISKKAAKFYSLLWQSFPGLVLDWSRITPVFKTTAHSSVCNDGR